jgi:hypothetical protein
MKQVFGIGGLTETNTKDPGNDVGRIRIEDGNIYRLVQNKEASAALTVGQLAFHKLSDGATMLKKVYKCLTANLSVCGGVVLATSLAAAEYGWVQCYGYNASVSVSGATTGGADIAVGGYLKGVDANAHAVLDHATSPTYQRTLRALQTVTTTTTPAAALIAAEIRCI